MSIIASNETPETIEGWLFQEENEGPNSDAADLQPSPHHEAAVDFVYEIHKGNHTRQVTIRQLPSRGLSFQLWPAGSALCSFLEETYGTPGMWISCISTTERLESSSGEHGGMRNEFECYHKGSVERKAKRRLRVLELGSGTGLVGLVAACLGAEVVLTDLGHVIPNLQHNIALNVKEIEACGGLIVAQILRWGVKEDIEKLGSFDIVLASDVVYYDTLFDPLLKTMKWLLQSTDPMKLTEGIKQTTLQDVSTLSYAHQPSILIAHVRRWKKDAQFFRSASKYFDLQEVHRYPATAEIRKGIVIYKLTSREKL